MKVINPDSYFSMGIEVIQQSVHPSALARLPGMTSK